MNKPPDVITGFIVFVAVQVSVASGQSTVSADEKVARPLVLAHYMPWYTARPFSERWGWHWTMNHFDPDSQTDGKREVAAKFYPLIGPYDSGDPDVLEYHLLLMKLAGIDGVIVDWYGLTDLNDYAILHRNTTRLLQQCERLKMKFVICYEDQTIPALVTAERILATDRVAHAASEIQWLSQYWFKSPSYALLDGQPVLLSFGHAGLTNEEWSDCLSRLESPVAYFSQDFRRQGAVGGFGWPSPARGLNQVNRFVAESKHWPHSIPAAFPRFIDIYRDANVSEGFPQLEDNDGRTFQSTMQSAIAMTPRLIQIATWNDWGEGTQIEPSQEFGYRDLEFLQRVCHIPDATDAATRPAVLRLPSRLLQSRQSGVGSHDTLDAVVSLILDRQWDTAQAALDAVAAE